MCWRLCSSAFLQPHSAHRCTSVCCTPSPSQQLGNILNCRGIAPEVDSTFQLWDGLGLHKVNITDSVIDVVLLQARWESFVCLDLNVRSLQLISSVHYQIPFFQVRGCNQITAKRINKDAWHLSLNEVWVRANKNSSSNNQISTKGSLFPEEQPKPGARCHQKSMWITSAVKL